MDILTPQFEQSLKPVDLMFPKSTPKKKKTMIDYARAKKRIVRGVPAKKKVKRTKLPSIKSLKLKTDKVFSLYIRQRDHYTCVLCKRKKNVQCGHLIKRGKMATRYDEINCHALCSGCNYKDNFEPQHYILWFFTKYGAGQYIKLVEKSKKIRQMKRQDFLEIIKRYGPTNPKP